MTLRQLTATFLLLPLLGCSSPPAPGSEGAAAPTTQGPPKLVYSEDVFDAGRVESGAVVRHAFTLHNAGGEPLVIAASPTCGCTIASADERIPPGGEGRVVVEMDTTTLQGAVNKIVNVTTNDPLTPLVKLRMRAEVTLPILVTPRQKISFTGNALNIESQILSLIARDGEPFDVLRVSTENPWIETLLRPRPDVARRQATGMKAEPREPAPGAVVGGHAAYEIEIGIADGAIAGFFTDAIVVHTNHPGAEQVRILASGELDVGVVIEPRRVFFLNRGEESQVEYVELRRQEGVGLSLLGAATKDPAFRVEVEELTEGSLFRIAVHRDMSRHEPGRVYQDELRILTDFPGREELSIPIIAR